MLASRRLLIDELVSPELAVLVYGEISGSDAPATAVEAAYRKGGVAGVGALDGDFSAVVVDRRERRLVACSDLIGRRRLSYSALKPRVLLSPHDAALVASGLCPLVYDAVTAATIAAVDWSVGGHSLLQGVRRLSPLRALAWQTGEVREPVLAADLIVDRTSAGDGCGIQDQVRATLDHLGDSARDFVRHQSDEVRTTLTAGMDSRTVWALLASVVSPARLVAITSGASRSADVLVAGRLAAMVGAKHLRIEPSAGNADDFVRHAKLRAFVTNGDTSAKRAFSPFPDWDRTSPLGGGVGGEIYRGFYYPYFAASRMPPRDPRALAARLTHPFVGRA